MTLKEFENWVKNFVSKDGAVNCSPENRLIHIKFMLEGVNPVEDRAFLALKYSEYLT